MENLSKSQFARMLGVSPAYVSKLISEGKITTREVYGSEVIPLTEENLKIKNQLNNE